MELLSVLPTFNACMNATSFFCLLSGYWAIKAGRKELHKSLMLAALAASAIFLMSYLYYHFHFPTKKFPELGAIKTIYLCILLTHTVLAVAMLPLILNTFRHAFAQRWDLHMKWARWAFPIWCYVSSTGVLIYFMLYQWFVTEV